MAEAFKYIYIAMIGVPDTYNDHRVLAPRVLAQLFSGSCPRYTKVLSAIFQGPVRVGYFNTFAQLFFSGFCPIISRICPIISGFCPIISRTFPII